MKKNHLFRISTTLLSSLVLLLSLASPALAEEKELISYSFFVQDEVIATQYFKDGESVTTPPAPKVKGLTFLGWEVETPEGLLPLDLSAPASIDQGANINVYARFEEDAAPNKENRELDSTSAPVVIPEAIPETTPESTPPAKAEEVSEPGSKPIPEAAPEQPAELPPTPRRLISIDTNLSAVIEQGEPVTMTAILEGFDDVSVALQWQCRDGGEWVDIPGANGLKYIYKADEANLRQEWRIKLTILSTA